MATVQASQYYQLHEDKYDAALTVNDVQWRLMLSPLTTNVPGTPKKKTVVAVTSLSSVASRRRLPGLIRNSLNASALGCGAGSSGAYVSLRMASCTELRL